jgi:hypothetical protein
MRTPAVLVLVVAATVGCNVTSEPAVVEGTLVDAVGQPVPNVTVVLDAFDNRGNAPGEGFEQFEVETTTGPDGRFEFRFAPSDQLRRLAGANARAVNFAITAFDPRRRLTWSWSFSRGFGTTSWQHEATPIRLTPVGAGF